MRLLTAVVMAGLLLCVGPALADTLCFVASTTQGELAKEAVRNAGPATACLWATLSLLPPSDVALVVACRSLSSSSHRPSSAPSWDEDLAIIGAPHGFGSVGLQRVATRRSPPPARHGATHGRYETHTTQRPADPRYYRADASPHDGCGGRAGKAELLTGIEGVSSRPVRRIVLF